MAEAMYCSDLECKLAVAVPPRPRHVAGLLAAHRRTQRGPCPFQTPNTAAMIMRVEANQYGAVSDLRNLARNLGLLTGASLVGALFAAGVGGAGVAGLAFAPPQAVAAGLCICFWVAAAMGGRALLFTVCSLASSTWHRGQFAESIRAPEKSRALMRPVGRRRLDPHRTPARCMPHRGGACRLALNVDVTQRSHPQLAGLLARTGRGTLHG